MKIKLMLISLFGLIVFTGCNQEPQTTNSHEKQPEQVSTKNNNSAVSNYYDGFKAGEQAAEAMMMSVAAN